MRIGAACADLPLVTAGSGVAVGLPPAWRATGVLAPAGRADELPRGQGHAAAVAGSCSAATLGQVARALEAGMPGFRVEPLALAAGEDVAGVAVAWALPRLAAGPVLVYASADPDRVRAAQERLGRERAGALVEEALGRVARGLVEAGVGRLVVAGGETSGAVVGALHVAGLRIGPEIAPGVPWTAALGDRPLSLVLKSGNFGGRDFLLEAWSRLP